MSVSVQIHKGEYTWWKMVDKDVDSEFRMGLEDGLNSFSGDRLGLPSADNDAFLTQHLNNKAADSPPPSYDSNDHLTLQKSMHPVLRAMQALGFLPCSLPTTNRSKRSSFQVTVALRLLCLVYVVVNSGIFAFNVYVTNEIKKGYGFLSMDCISSVMNGLKPCHGLFNLVILLCCCSHHRALLQQMWAVDRAFRKHFRQSPNLRVHRNVIVGMYIAIFGITFSARMSQYVLYEEQPGDSFFSDISLVLVPCLSIWQVVPIVYFVFLTKIVRFWFLELQHQLVNDKTLIRKPLLFYYERYLQLTDVVVLIGTTFNPLIFVSLAMSVAIVCLTIFFVTTAPEVLPTTMDTEDGFDVVTMFYLLWSSLQIIVAICYVGAICIAGTLTNENARKISSTVLSVVPESDRDRHVVMCFLQKVATQHAWGLTVWRAFPIERHLLFTLMSIMGTYAVVLLKMKQSTGEACLTMKDLFNFINQTVNASGTANSEEYL